MGKLERKGGEDDLSVTPVVGLSRAKKTCAKFSLSKGNLSKCLGDGRLSLPRDALKP